MSMIKNACKVIIWFGLVICIVFAISLTTPIVAQDSDCNVSPFGNHGDKNTNDD